MKILVIGSAFPDTSPGSRFRIEQWMPVMAKENVVFDYAAFEDEKLHRVLYTQGNQLAKGAGMLRGFARRLQLLRSVDRYDVVFIYEEAARLGPAIIERLIAKAGVPIVYDFCDPIYLHINSPTNGYWSHLKFVGKTATICRLATHVLVGNEELANYARTHNRRVTVVPITIDTDQYRPRPWPSQSQSQSVPVLGWTGSHSTHSTVPHLDGLRSVLERLRQQHTFKLRVIGTRRWEAAGIEVEAQAWQAATEVSDLESMDIGIMPLPNDPWVRRRSHLKIRQYMGLGIPCVASPVGVNTELIEDGVNGFLANSDEEWMEKIGRLIRDADLRKKLGAAGRRTIEQRYSAKLWAPRVLEILRQAAATRRAHEPLTSSHGPARV
jgi:glycosyltransferase involved in cell wall biosynthesis